MQPFEVIEYGLALGMAIALIGVGVALALRVIVSVFRKRTDPELAPVSDWSECGRRIGGDRP